MDSGLFSVSFGLMFDSVTVMMLILVTTVSSLVHIYSTGYMSGDPHLQRFMSHYHCLHFYGNISNRRQCITTFHCLRRSRIMFIFINKLWYTRIQANKSAIKAMLINRVGDVCLALGMFVCYYTFKSLDYTVMFALAPYMLMIVF